MTMRKMKGLSFTIAFMLIFTALFANPFFVSAAEGEQVEIIIVHTNDTHGRVKEGSYDGMGFGKIATKVKEIRAENENVLVLDAGDAFHGQTIASLVEGESIVKIMDAIGYDAMVPGNHDFNYGQERLVELAELAGFSILSSNVIKEDGETLLPAYEIKELGGLKIGIFGLSTPETTYKTHPKNVVGLTFKDPIEVAKSMVEELKDEVDVVIALSHLGMDESSTDTSIKVAQEVEGIDLIVDGHSHSELPEGMLVNNTLIVQAGEFDKNLGIVELVYQDGEITNTATLLTKEEAAELAEDEDLVALVEEIEAENSVVLSAVVGSTDVYLDGERENVRAGETNLGNLITSAMVEATGADIAITNGGGIRASIEAGEITKGDVITVLPFGNYVVVKEISGANIVAALEHGIDSYPATKGAFPHVAGMEFTFDEANPAGSRVVEVKVNGEILDPAKMYKVATNDFMAAGGDDYTMLADGELLGEYPALDEVMISYIEEHGTEAAKVEGRINVIEAPQVEEPVAEEPAIEAPVEEEAQTDEEVYIVISGDVLWKIAKGYGITWETLAEYNNLENPNLLLPGQKLLVPAK